MTIFHKLAGDCEREDCRIGCVGMTSTLAHSMDLHDKHGRRIPASDPNVYTTHYQCLTCGKSWTVTGDVITETPPSSAA